MAWSPRAAQVLNVTFVCPDTALTDAQRITSNGCAYGPQDKLLTPPATDAQRSGPPEWGPTNLRRINTALHEAPFRKRTGTGRQYSQGTRSQAAGWDLMHEARAAENQTQAFVIRTPDRATEAGPKMHETVFQSGSSGSQATKITPKGHGKPQRRRQERQGPQLMLGCTLKHPSSTTSPTYVTISISRGFGQRTT